MTIVKKKVKPIKMATQTKISNMKVEISEVPMTRPRRSVTGIIKNGPMEYRQEYQVIKYLEQKLGMAVHLHQ